jgi:hypothetical protein
MILTSDSLVLFHLLSAGAAGAVCALVFWPKLRWFEISPKNLRYLLWGFAGLACTSGLVVSFLTQSSLAVACAKLGIYLSVIIGADLTLQRELRQTESLQLKNIGNPHTSER